MDLKEKLLLIECILRDLRCDWSFNVKYRINLILSLIEDIKKEKNVNGLDTLKETVDEFMKDINKEWLDGRFFRREYPKGYEKMDKIHTLSRSCINKSTEFKNFLFNLNCPEMYVENY